MNIRTLAGRHVSAKEFPQRAVGRCMAVSHQARLSALLLATSLLLLPTPHAHADTEPPARYRAKLPTIDPASYAGTVDVELYVETNAYGYVTHAEVRRATDAALGAICTQAVRHWRYAPAREYGQPVPARFIQPFRFTGGRLEVAVAQSVASPQITDSR